jgi:hypothetical protein
LASDEAASGQFLYLTLANFFAHKFPICVKGLPTGTAELSHNVLGIHPGFLGLADYRTMPAPVIAV